MISSSERVYMARYNGRCPCCMRGIKAGRHRLRLWVSLGPVHYSCWVDLEAGLTPLQIKRNLKKRDKVDEQIAADQRLLGPADSVTGLPAGVEPPQRSRVREPRRDEVEF